MATDKGITSRRNYEDIADAIREKNGLLATYTPGSMADAIRALPSGCPIRLLSRSGEVDTSNKSRSAKSLLSYSGSSDIVLITRCYNESDAGRVDASAVSTLAASFTSDIIVLSAARSVDDIEPDGPWNPNEPYTRS